MMNRILLCCDLDRTVLPNGHQPESPGVRELFARLAGFDDILLAYVSGRDKVLLLEAIEEYQIPVPDYAIGDVGTTMYRIHDGNWSQMDSWEKHIAEDWLNTGPEQIQHYLDDFEQLQLQQAEKQGKFKLSYYAPTESDTGALLKNIEQRLHDNAIRANLIWSIDETKNIGLLDILPARANKLHAIEFLITQTGCVKSNTVFAGDSGNDLPVIVSDIPSVLVKNATSEVRNQALSTIKQNGNSRSVYFSQGNFHELNGNYAAGIIEGLVHYHPELDERLAQLVTV